MTITRFGFADSKIDEKGHLFRIEGSPRAGSLIETCGVYSFHFFRGMSSSCASCDAYGDWEWDPKTNLPVLRNEPCSSPRGFKVVTRLAVPSGRIIVNDSLRKVYNYEENEHSYNSFLGQKEVVEGYEKLGCAYGPVLNTCPTLYLTDAQELVVANLPWDEEKDDYLLPAGWTPLAHITTNLWAYTIADYEDWLSKGGHEVTESSVETVVEVPAGVYEFELYTTLAGFDWETNGAIYALGRKVTKTK